jgi:hypothetical protein
MPLCIKHREAQRPMRELEKLPVGLNQSDDFPQTDRLIVDL